MFYSSSYLSLIDIQMICEPEFRRNLVMFKVGQIFGERKPLVQVNHPTWAWR